MLRTAVPVSRTTDDRTGAASFVSLRRDFEYRLMLRRAIRSQSCVLGIIVCPYSSCVVFIY